MSSGNINRKLEKQRNVFQTFVLEKGLVPLVLTDDTLCDDIQNDSVVKKKGKLGSGTYGSVYLVEVPEMGKKEYALKEIKRTASRQKLVVNSSKMTYEELAIDVVKSKFFIPEKIFYLLNEVTDPNDPVSIMKSGGRFIASVVLPDKKVACADYKVIQHPITKEKIRVPEGSWICNGYDPLADIYFGQLASNLYLSGKAINFVPMFGYSQCFSREGFRSESSKEKIDGYLEQTIEFVRDKLKDHLHKTDRPEKDKEIVDKKLKDLDKIQGTYKSFSQKKKINYINYFFEKYKLKNDELANEVLQISNQPDVTIYLLMEKVDTTLSELSLKFGNPETNQYDLDGLHSLYIQLLFSIAMMQESYHMVHGDLHLGNIFIEFVRPLTTFNDQTLYDADYFHYKIGQRNIYTKRVPFIVKIGDFGFSKQFISDRIVMDKRAIDQNNKTPEGDPRGNFTSWYSTSYDILMSFAMIYYRMGLERINEYDEVSRRFFKTLFFASSLYVPKHGKFSERLRPLPKFVTYKDKKGFSAKNLLNQDFFNVFTEEPPRDSKVVTLGEL